MNRKGQWAEPLRPSTDVIPSPSGLPTLEAAPATPLRAREVASEPARRLSDVIYRLAQAALVRRVTEAEASIQADCRQRVAEQVWTAEAFSEARVRLAQIELEEQIQLAEVEAERDLRGVVRLLPDSEAHDLIQRVTERAQLLRDCAGVRSSESDILARHRARAAIAAARREAEAEEAALQLQRRVHSTPGHRGRWLAAEEAGREQYLLDGERSRRERLQRSPAESPLPPAAPLGWAPSDGQLRKIALNFAVLVKSLDPADQERAAAIIDELLAPILPPLDLAEVHAQVEELLTAANPMK